MFACFVCHSKTPSSLRKLPLILYWSTKHLPTGVWYKQIMKFHILWANWKRKMCIYLSLESFAASVTRRIFSRNIFLLQWSTFSALKDSATLIVFKSIFCEFRNSLVFVHLSRPSLSLQICIRMFVHQFEHIIIISSSFCLYSHMRINYTVLETFPSSRAGAVSPSAKPFRLPIDAADESRILKNLLNKFHIWWVRFKEWFKINKTPQTEFVYFVWWT